MPDPALRDRSLLVAASGSTLLAIPGAIAAAGLVPFFLLAASGQTRVLELLAVAALLLVPSVGFYLLVGYWGEVGRQGRPRPRWFWWLSAGYNGAGIGVTTALLAVHTMRAMDTAVSWWSMSGLVAPPLLVPVLFWTLFMAVLSAQRARRKREPTCV